MIHRIQASIDRSALAANLRCARQHAGGGRTLAVIKANAYGHGLLPVAEALQEADLFAVTDVHEAERLRSGGCDKDILVLQGLIEPADIARISAGNFQVVIHHSEQLGWLEQALDSRPPPAPLTFWLKLDSGMGRLGLAAGDYAGAYRALAAKPWTRSVVMMTHLASASQPDAPLNGQQFAAFERMRARLQDMNPQTSIAASAALLAFAPQAHWSRPGLMLYGSSPFSWADHTRRRDRYGLRAAMTLQARLISIRELQAGDSVGYNSQYVCAAPMRVGIVSAGYADGYPSTTPNHCPVALHGKRTHTLGRVSMDMLAIDLEPVPEARIGDIVELWGPQVSLDEVAAHTGILSYNLTCSITSRVPLIHV